MYLAPLNYDRFFKKVFSDLEISKKFLEDFLDVKIDLITKLDSSRRVTDDSAVVEFDFRCKIDGAFVIVDMQQWYKSDVAHRFYVYHAVSTSLQLEDLPIKSIVVDKKTGEDRKTRDYKEIEPVLTIVWMVDDSLGFDDDMVAYRMFPEDIRVFLTDSELWESQEIQELLSERDRLYKQLSNKTKSLDFIHKNRLIFAFQKNIVKNHKIKKYIKWFELAAKTKNRKNEISDFVEFEQDEKFRPIYNRIKKRLVKNNLEAEELKYITEESSRRERVKRYIDGEIQDKNSEIEMIQMALDEKDKALEDKDKALKDKDKALKDKDKALKDKDKAIELQNNRLKKVFKNLVDQGFSEEVARKMLNLEN